jgi:hypothetical protein
MKKTKSISIERKISPRDPIKKISFSDHNFLTGTPPWQASLSSSGCIRVHRPLLALFGCFFFRYSYPQKISISLCFLSMLLGVQKKLRFLFFSALLLTIIFFSFLPSTTTTSFVPLQMLSSLVSRNVIDPFYGLFFPLLHDSMRMARRRHKN